MDHTVMPGRARTALSRAEVVDTAARVGLLAHGATHVIIGIIAVQVASGHGAHQADQSGALFAIAGTPFGLVLLWLLGAGFAGMALWKLHVAVFGDPTSPHPVRARLEAVALALLYPVLAGSATAFAAGRHAPRSSDDQSHTLTARALALPGGRVGVGLVGLAIGIVGVALAVRGLRGRFREQVRRTGRLPGRLPGRVVEYLGVVGHVARGVVFALLGTFVLRAAVEFDPDRAKGLDGTLRAFAHTPAGPFLLVAVALGLVAFGLYSCCEAVGRRVR